MKICLDGQTTSDASVVALGMFDGVHVGHRILLEKARKTANRENVPLVVQTFAKHPLQLLDPEHCPPMLTTLEERIRLMEKYGVDIYCALPFTEKVRNTLPEEFVGRLVSRWKPRAVVVGFNYSFGKDGSGSPAILRALGNALRFETIVIPAITIGERPVSATEIRSLLANGCVRQARRLLGRPYSRMTEVMLRTQDQCVLRLIANGKQDLPAGKYRCALYDGKCQYPTMTSIQEDGLLTCTLPSDAALGSPATLQFISEISRSLPCR